MSAIPWSSKVSGGRDADESMLDDIVRICADVLSKGGITQEESALIADELCAALTDRFGGSQPYWPVGKSWRLRQRCVAIARWHKGDIEATRAKFGISAQHAYRCIEAGTKIMKSDRTGQLFPDLE